MRRMTPSIENWLAVRRLFSSLQSSGTATGAPGRALTEKIRHRRGHIIIAEKVDEDFSSSPHLGHGINIGIGYFIQHKFRN
jgi:hypothetical protein